MRYLVYAIDKHQSTPKFCNALRDVDIENARDGFDVIVDLHTRERYFNGQWCSVDCYTVGDCVDRPENDKDADNET